MNYIVSLSGGKDSTAMLHWMLEKNEKIHSVIFMDTGWEFPEMLDHIDLIEKKTGIKIIRLKSKKSFNHWMYHHKIISRSGEMKYIGTGWPSASRRWCTREKVYAINRYLKTVQDPVSCIGYAFDEQHRKRYDNCRYPLIEYKKTESDCLEYCKKLGYNWNGLYDIFKRVSCWCCPLQSIKGTRILRKEKPKLWLKLIEMDLRQPKHNPGFIGNYSVLNLENKFRDEEKNNIF